MPTKQAALESKTAAGFSLTELIIAAVMLLIVLGSLASIFESTNRHTAATERRYRQESNVDADLALIAKLNEHYTCAAGTTSVTCTSNIDAHPTKNGFFPDPTATTLVASFEDHCNNTNNQALLTPLIGSGQIIETQAPDNEVRLPGLTRTIASDLRGHRYTVTYYVGDDTNGEMLRQASFVPTTANWCPEIP